MVAPHRRIVAVVSLRSGIVAFFLAATVDLTDRAAMADMAAAQAAIAAGNDQAAAQALRPMAETGDTQAQFQLAKLAFDGHDVGLTSEQAMSLLIQAASQGNGPAQAYLGLAYAEGRHVARSDLAAYQWLSRASISRDLTESERTMVNTNRAALLSRLAPGDTTGAEAEPAMKIDPVIEAEPVAKPAPAKKDIKPAPAEPVQPVRDTGSAGYIIQLASLPSEPAAQVESQRLQQKFAAALAGLTISLQTVDLGSKGIYHRIQAGPFDSRDRARSRCAEFKAAQQDCIVVAARN
ncbi:MAG: SPOR domain-containing protein [Dongiaceae bacterium]